MGLGLPDLHALALAARTAALATIPGDVPFAARKAAIIAHESPTLFAQLQARLAQLVAELVGDLHHIREGKSTRHLSRKLMHSIHLHGVNSLKREESNMSAAMRHNWARNRSRNECTANSHYTGQGAWLRATPGNAANTISNETFRCILGHRLGLNAQGAGQVCRKTLRLGQGPTCQRRLNELGLHAAACARHTNRHRHDELRDHIGHYLRTAGIASPSSRHGLPMMHIDMPTPCTQRTYT